MPDIYDEGFQIRLFDEMARTYGIVNCLSSFGFNYRWRKNAYDHAGVRAGDVVCDLMAGFGEMGLIIDVPVARLLAIEFSPVMADGMRRNLARRPFPCAIAVENVFLASTPAASVDKVLCAFGTKTLNPADRRRLVDEVHRMLRSGGVASLMEFTVPANAFLRFFWTLYVRRAVPVIGWLLMGNPDNYRMLYEYTTRFAADGLMDFVAMDPRFAVQRSLLHFGSAVNWVLRKV